MVRFTLFSKLPPEIRDEIWQLCLPRRVLELDHTYLATCWHEYATWQNGRPPALTRVCREARRVAQLHGKFNCLTLAPAPDGEVWERYWHQLYLDSVHLHFMSPLDGPRWVRNGETSFTHAMTGAWNMATPLSFSEHLFRLFGQPQYRPHRPQAKEHYAIAAQTGETFRVVFMIITIHLGPAQVTSSGLFGHLGDEIVKLVDVEDTELIEKYHALFCTSQRQPENEHFNFDRLLSSSVWREMLQEWPKSGQTLLLAASWVNLDSKGPNSQLDTFWDHPREIVTPDYLYPENMMDPSRYDRFIVPNYENELVKRLIPTFPKLVPSVMFRACTNDRCEAQLAKYGRLG